jgi:cytochrome c peroxidase
LLQICPAFAGNLHLEIQPEWNGSPLTAGQQLSSTNDLAITRLDGLLSHLSLQRADGSWINSGEWHVFFSVEKLKLLARADGVPAEKFKAIRFLVGLDEATDRSDPQDREPTDPLHPSQCGLHWGWNSGYVFLAVEGRWQHADGERSGFSYHLAGTQMPMWVELPVDFSGEHATTLSLVLNVSMLLEGAKILREAESTHSREGDLLAETLKKRVSRAFAVRDIRTDTFQRSEQADSSTIGLRISERLPKVSFPKDNPLTPEGVELGRMLFEEPRLSRGDAQSCANCHQRENSFADHRKLSVGAEGMSGRRNTMPLVNLAWAEGFFWDGRAKSLREQALLPIQDANEMNETLERVITKLENSQKYSKQFAKAFGSTNITAARVGLALEQFLLTLVSQDSKFDRAARKLTTLTAQEQRGLQLFVTESDPTRGLRGADCFHCHGGNLFSNQQFMNNGLEPRSKDLGRMEVTNREEDRGKFKVPTLRNVAVSGPYMHDGRFATLEEVVDHYNGKLHRSATLDPNLAKHPESGLGLDDSDKAALVAFLKTLTDESFIGANISEKHLTKIK